MNSTTPKDPKALLLAFADMLNEFYGPEADDTNESSEPATSTPAQAGMDMDSPVETKQNVHDVRGPWDDIDVNKKMGINLQVEPVLYKKMTWLKNNVPKLSLHKIAVMGLEAEIERLLSLHYRPE